ncbi:ECF transporter S component [Clostridium vincentii]|uniref:ECF transporter S component n=1 Tax=Clostridium vincentii TaxID=52704 RepID=A0A2T0BFY7_9CLOT|nr:ECF transporter S component [Clostridium vincentii]PRR82742.1 hypothetical protein CLVI_15520 [Clostridium vincentii]
MLLKYKNWIYIISFSCLYNVLYLFSNNIPNPAVPNGFIAISMVIPVVAGYLLGPYSGAMTGGIGVGLNVLINGSPITVAAMVPIMIMGFAAGYVGKNRNILLTSLTIIIGHSLNILYFIRLGLISSLSEKISVIALSLLSEAAFDIVIIITIITSLKKFFRKERW